MSDLWMFCTRVYILQLLLKILPGRNIFNKL